MTTTPTIWLPEFTVNSSATAGNQTAAKSVTLLDGRVLSVWVDDANNVDASAGTDVIGQIFDATGNPAGTPFQLNEYFTSANEQNADIVALPDGGFAVVYEDRGAANGENAAIRYNVYNKYGIHIDSGTVDTGTIGGTENANPSVIVLADGSIAVTYERTTLGNTDTVTRIVDLATGTAGALLQAADNNGADTEASAETAVLATGNLVTVYERESAGQTSVEFKIMDGAGATVGSVTELSSDGSGVQVATLASGNFVVAWVDGAGGGLRAEVRGNSGAVVTANFQVAAGATAPAGADAVALKDGGFFLTWKDGAAGELVGQRFDAAGGLVGDIVTIASGAAVADAKTSLAHDGRILVTFANASGEISQVILDPRDNVINGSEFRDALTSRVEGATVNGLGGNDTIVGLGGDDALYGGSKRDLLSGGAGNDFNLRRLQRRHAGWWHRRRLHAGW